MDLGRYNYQNRLLLLGGGLVGTGWISAALVSRLRTSFWVNQQHDPPTIEEAIGRQIEVTYVVTGRIT